MVLNLRGRQLYVQFGIIFYALAGIPISLHADLELTKTQIAVATFFYSGHAIAVVFNLYTYYPSVYELKYTAKAGYDLVWAVYTTGNLILAAVMIWSRKTLIGIFNEIQSLDRILKVHTANGSRAQFRSAPLVCLLALYLVTIAVDIYFCAVDYWGDYGYDSMRNILVIVLTLVAATPSTIIYWTYYYNTTIWYMMEIDFNDTIHRRMYTTRSSQSLSAVLPPVEGDTPMLYYIGRETSSYSSGQWNTTTSHCTKMLKTHFNLKSVRLSINRWYYMAVSFNMLTDTAVIPFMIFQACSYRDPSERWYIILVSIIDILVSVLLITYNQWVKYSNRCLSAKKCREIFNTTDMKVRSALIKIVFSAKDEYPDSPCVFFDFDDSLLSTLVNAAVLVTTTLLVPQT